MQPERAFREKRIAYVDGLRGLAVLGVVFLHAFGTSVRPSFAPYITAVGARGVDLFFVLSGFCVSLAVVAPQNRNVAPKPPLAFLISRFARVAPSYYAALALFAVLSLTPFGLPTVAGDANAIRAHTYLEVLREAAFVSTWPVYNVSFWTLGIEMQLYLLCPLLIKLFVSSKATFVAVGLACYALYASPWCCKLVGILPCFMLGIVAASLATDRAKLNARLVAIAAAFALTLAVAEQSRTSEFDHGNALWHVTCFLIVVAASRGVFRRVLSWKPLRMAGTASFSIYLVHQPFIYWGLSHHVPPALAAVGGVGSGFALWFSLERALAKTWQRRIERFMLGSIARCTRWTRGCRTVGGVR